jgi:NADH-quinone oxidoreductase subunit E
MSIKEKKTLNFTVLDAIIHKHNVQRGAIISILQEVQDSYGWIPKPAIQRISEATNVSITEIFGIVTFYAQFRLEPLGENVIKVCHGTACHLNGIENVSDSLCKRIETREGETSADGKYTVEPVACLGCCSLSPCIMVNGEVYGRLTPENVIKVVEELNEKKVTSPE